MYSQNDEEKIIVDYFKEIKNGRFIDIGGFHPIVFSNTRKLYEIGWSGVIVEPSPICFSRFIEEYNNEPRIILVNSLISSHTGMSHFFESNGDAISTTSEAHKDKWEKGSAVRFNQITVPSISMSDFLAKYGDNVDFINIDVESTNNVLFNLLPLSFLKNVKMICIEHDGLHADIENKLIPFGFKKILLNAENIILAK